MSLSLKYRNVDAILRIRISYGWINNYFMEYAALVGDVFFRFSLL